MPAPAVPPPPGGYDLILHLGAGRNGALSIEQIGHKSGYQSKDVDGKMAPVVAPRTDAHPREISAAERFETDRLRQGAKGDCGDNAESESVRGFAEGYACFPEELRTEVDVPGVIAHLKRQGETVSPPPTLAGAHSD